jgi:hypothetical protein
MIDEKILSFAGVNIQKPPQLEEETCHWESIVINAILHLNCNYDHNSMIKNNP